MGGCLLGRPQEMSDCQNRSPLADDGAGQSQAASQEDEETCRLPVASALCREPGVEETSPDHNADTLAIARKWWPLSLYSSFVHLVILAYFVLTIVAGVQLLGLALRVLLLSAATPLDAMDGVWWAIAALLLVLALRLAIHFLRSLLWLLSSRYDAALEASEGVYLPPQDYPALYAIIAEVSRALSLNALDEVRVTGHAECYAVERRSFSISTQRRLTVVLGLPNLAVLSLSELRVILAHEMAHIAVGDTRLEVYSFRFLKSLWDAAEASRRKWWRWVDPVTWIFFRAYYWFVLQLLAPLRRYQELRADFVSAALYGGNVAVRTLLKDWLVVHEFSATVALFDRGGHAGQVESDRSVYDQFLARWQELSPRGQQYLERRLTEEERGSFWDSHPTVQRRIQVMRAAPRQDEANVGCARDLLPDFERLAELLQSCAIQD